MATDREYLEYIKEQLSETEGVSFRPMMGEYILYTGGRVAGGIYDNRLLVKPTASAKALMPDAIYERPYEGAKEMLLVDNLDDRQFLRELFTAMYEDLPEKKKK